MPTFIRPEKFWLDLGLRAGETVVHLGAGAGFFLIPAAKIVGERGKCIGIDLLPHLLAEIDGRAAREGLGKIVHTIRANLENKQGSTLSADSADWVLVANIFHQSDPLSILKEARRVAKTDGQIVVVEWSQVAAPFGPPNEVRVSLNQAKAFATQAGLVLSREFAPSAYHYGLVLVR